jgi:hypothetical protein
MRSCAPCGAFIQPDWEHCKICGAPAGAPATPAGSQGDSSTADNPFSHRSVQLAALAVAAVVALLTATMLSGSGSGSDAPPEQRADTSGGGGAPSTEPSSDRGDAGDTEAASSDEEMATFVGGLERELGFTFEESERACVTEFMNTGGIDLMENIDTLRHDEAMAAIAEFRSGLIGGCLPIESVVINALTSRGIGRDGAECVATSYAGDPALQEFWFAVVPDAVAFDVVVRADEVALSCLSQAEFDLWVAQSGPGG